MEELNRNLTNEALIELLGDTLKDGLMIIIDKIPTSVAEYTMLYVAQEITDLPSSTDVTEFEAKALGWDNTLIMRAMFNADTTIAEEYPKGTKIEGARIRVYDTLEPEFADQSPRLTREKDAVRVLQGQPIYRQSHVVFDDEFQKLGGHGVLEYDNTVPIGTAMLKERSKIVSAAKLVGDSAPITT